MPEQRHTHSIDAIKQMLIDRIEDVVHLHAPAAPGSYRKGELYFTLNPGRADTRVGSFCVHMSGPRVGQWHDYAMSGREAHGDLIDLIGLSLNLNGAQAIAEARRYLGLEVDTPEARRARDQAAERAKVRRAEEERLKRERAEASKRRARGLWLSGQEGIAGTPVEAYLRGRGIDLRALGRQPGAIRFHPEVTYIEEREAFDPETGEIATDAQGRPLIDRLRHKWPAMLSAIVNGAGEIVACHRTYLARRPDGSWGKAPVPDAKKVLGDYRGGCVRLSTGVAEGGKRGRALNQCPPGSRVYIAEGIETALSAVVLRPEARVVAGVSLRGMAAVELPANVAEVVLVADHDTHPSALAAFQAAIEAHAKAGRVVRVWRSPEAGEDLNDALMRAIKEKGAA